MSDELIIKTEKLRKVYKGGIEAVKGIDLDIKKGEVYGFLGPNGAGKSTTIKMLSTLISPTSGSATVAGLDIEKDSMKIRKIIGVVPQDLTTDEDLRGMENIELVARFYDIPRAEATRRGKELLDLVDLADFGNKNVSTYSGGMRKRLELVVGLVNEPEVLFLDEPTLGLDVQTRSKMWEYIRKIQTDLGVTIILTSHYLEEVDSLANRISIIDHGKIIVTGTPDELKNNLKGDVVQIEFANKSQAENFARYENKIDATFPKENEVRLKVKDSDYELPDIMRYIVDGGMKPLKFSVHKPSLDQVFLEYTGREIREEEGNQDTRKMAANMRRLRR
jgi:ABC-2 type transport system ATP-binding protein